MNGQWTKTKTKTGDSGRAGWVWSRRGKEAVCSLGRRTVAVLLATMLVAPFGASASAQQKTIKGNGSAQSSATPSGKSRTANAAYSDSKAAATLPDDPEIARLQTTDQSSGAPQTSPAQKPSKPLGTAVAPHENTVGVAASRPAGAAIAPAKQRRVRSLLIKVGVLVGAAVAVGTVIGLSKASSSRPH